MRSKRFNSVSKDGNIFKSSGREINDTFGHEIGDELLKQFSERVKGHLRESDTFARQGGDEFTIHLSEIKKESDAEIAAKRILASLGRVLEN